MKMLDVYSVFDIELVKANGSFVWDSQGNKYLDLYGGHAVISIGHSHPHFIQLLNEQLNKISFYSNSIKIPLQDELANKLGEISDYNDYSLFLCNSGAEANENAMKLASFYNKRNKILSFKKSFHGRTSLAVAATDDTKIQAPINQSHNIIFTDYESWESDFTDDICAVIIEGIQGVGGINLPSDEMLQRLSIKCQDTDTILILDEIQSGYGRSGKFFAHQYSGIKPDLITVAKGMGNGFPIAGVLISDKFNVLKGQLGTTFGGGYLACAAGIAILDVLLHGNLIENAYHIGAYLISNLQKYSFIKEVRGRGLMIGIELFENCTKMRNELLHNHKIFAGNSSNPNTIRLLPPLNISKNEIDLFLEVMDTYEKIYKYQNNK